MKHNFSQAKEVLKQEVRSSIEEATREKYEASLDNFIQWAQENGQDVLDDNGKLKLQVDEILFGAQAMRFICSEEAPQRRVKGGSNCQC